MPTVVSPSPATVADVATMDSSAVTRLLVAVYARERVEDAIRAVAEDALSPGRADLLSWHDEAGFDDDLGKAVRDIAASANLLLADRLADLIAHAPPGVVGRLTSVPRWPEQA
jgi:hypothetical protein